MARAKETLPTMQKYTTHAKKSSTFNTPPCFAIYLCKLVMEWMKENGGVAGNEKRNFEKAEMLYKAIDDSNGFYKGHAEKDSRSNMNVTFRLPTEELEAKCVSEGLQNELLGLKGHRSVGGMRASIYNSMPVEGVEKLCGFLNEFMENNK
jgi:phosphoserine aminotransferase